MSSTISIHNRAMLVGLTIHQWSARKHDKRITRDVAERESAQADAGRYNKRLLPKEALAFMSAKASALRTEHYKRTLPWSDDGPRILSSSAYMEYMAAMRPLKYDFERAADNFASDYPRFRMQATGELGKLFNDGDYPHPDDIRAKFGIAINVLPMPSAEDFRAKLPADELDAVRQDIEKQITESMQRGQQDIFRRASEVLARMVDRLTKYDPGTNGQRPTGIFRDTLVGNIRELVDVLPSLNVTDSPAVAKLYSDLDTLTDNLEPNQLRENAALRRHTADAAQAILDRVSGYLA